MAVSPLAVDGGVTSDAVTLFVERAARGAARVRDLRRADRGRGDRDLRDARRAAPRHRAGRGADGGDERGRGARPARRPVPAADRTRSSDRIARRRCGTRWPGPTTCWTTTSARLLRTASVFAGGFDLPALCAVAEASDDVEVLRLLDSLVRKSLVVAHHGSARTRYSLFETIRAFADERLAEAGERDAARDRHAAYFAGEAARRWERWNGPGWRDQVDWVQTRAGQPAVGVPVERRPRSRRGGHRRRRPRRADGVLGRAVRDHRVGRGRCSTRRPGRRPAAPPAVRRGGLRLLRRAGRGRDRARPPGHRAGGPTRATSPASPATRRSSRRSDRSTAGTWTATSS